jgi:uncharacterized protein (TIGR01777 family)
MRTLITGATGLLGKALLARVRDGVVLSRDPDQAVRRLGAVAVHAWAPEAGSPPGAALQDVDVIFNLAGAPIAEGRWTAERKRSIRDSRVLGTRNLVAGMAAMARRPRVLVSVSAVGYYGDRGDEQLDEDASPGNDFLADVCVAWEGEALAAERLGVRVVCVRLGVVLAGQGGALARMLTPFKLGIAGRIGDGRQWMSWVYLDDAIGILLHASLDDRIRGGVNAVAPNPVTNAELTRVLGHVLHRPTVLAVPKLALRLALGEMSQVLTASQRVFPRVVERTGYLFHQPQLDSAIRAALAATISQ